MLVTERRVIEAWGRRNDWGGGRRNRRSAGRASGRRFRRSGGSRFGTGSAAEERALETLAGSDTLALVRELTMFLTHCADGDLGLAGFLAIIASECCAIIDGLSIGWSQED